MTETVGITSRVRTETRALRLLRDGWKPAQVSQDTGLSPAELERLRRDFPGAPRTLPPLCRTPGCGKPRAGGRPPAGWVKLMPVGSKAFWLCSWECVSRNAWHQHRGGAA